MHSDNSNSSVDRFVRELLGRLLSRYQDAQIFLFGSEGEPFWCAEWPISESQYALLEEATELIEKLEKERPKPFVGHDAGGRFALAALSNDSDLYVVVVPAKPGTDPPSAEARVVAMRHALLSEMDHLRNPELRIAAMQERSS